MLRYIFSIILRPAASKFLVGVYNMSGEATSEAVPRVVIELFSTKVKRFVILVIIVIHKPAELMCI